jgi:single-stranded DNA-binding protein
MTLANEVHITGKVATQPEQRGKGPIRFRLAHGGGGKGKDGSPWPTQFFTVITWHHSTVPAKGSRIEVWGKLREATWTAKDGTQRSAVEIVADAIQQEEEPEQTTSNIHGLRVTDADIPF